MTAAHKPDFALTLETPLGLMTLAEERGAITALFWGTSGEQQPTALLRRASRLLERYFAGQCVAFDLPLEPAGTPFERRVWKALRTIPWGETRTYGEIARQSGGSPRAVGQAVGHNPIPIIIPCHRVVAARGLGGFSAPGGVDTKRALLKLEGSLEADDLFADCRWRMGTDRKSEAMA
ncbi:MAG: methylated-DNA--[protein]-cysteine S-methyltransferase [Acetobacteraceae bacterium]